MTDVWLTLLDALDRIPRLFGLSLVQSLAIAGVVHLGLGGVAAIVAVRKGRDWRWWVPIGLIGGTPSLIAAINLKHSQLNRVERRALNEHPL